MINSTQGLGDECEKRLGENIKSENSIFMKINALFDILPLTIIIDDKIMCCHGGIGSSINKISEIAAIKRPIQIVQDVRTNEQQILLDLIWSEYSDEINDIAVNDERDLMKHGFITKYGKERVNKFLTDNRLSLLITSHQWIHEGIKTFNNEKVVVIYSATNYMDKFNNIAGMINITKKPSMILPKLIDVFKTDKKNYRPSKNISPVRWKTSK